MQDKAQAQRFDILISGFGPAGATLAALLGQRGLRVAVFDKYREIYPLPRAVALDHEVLRIFQQVGLSEDIPRVTAPYRTTIYAGADGAPVQQIETIAEPYPLAWPPNATFDQPALESALRARVAAQPNVEVFLEHEVCGYEEQAQGVRLHVRSRCGAQKKFSGAFLIACDGAQSPLRQQAGIGLEDMEFEQDWIVCDVRVNETALQRLPQTNVQYCTPQRPATFVVCPHNHRRWEFRVLPGEAFSHDVPEDVLWRLLQPWLAKGEGEIWRTASYRFAARMAQDWRKGRLFLAGDAAHQMPPFLGQGMCQGIRDAANLAWKLAQALAGPAPFRILDSYGSERKWHVREVTRVAISLGEIIGELDPHKAQARDARLLEEQGGSVKPKIRQAFIPGIAQSALVTQTRGAGSVFPQAFVRAGRQRVRLDDLAGAGPWLVFREAGAVEDMNAIVARAHRAGVKVAALAGAAAGILTLDECDGVLASWFEAQACAAALVRPDRYVYATAVFAGMASGLIEDYKNALT